MSTPYAADTYTTIQPFQGEWTLKQARHLARRTLFGATKEDVNKLADLEISEAMDLLLTEDLTPDPPINDYNTEEFKDPYVQPGETWINHRAEENEIIGMRVVSLKTWWIDKMLNQNVSLHEKMILFWHNHLATQCWGVFWPNLTYHHFDKIRKHAFGNFKTLIKEITIDPHMLLYLNGAFNNKEAPDENYARELQELFCIGKGPKADFTESDVQNAAKVLTGWTINWETGESYFNGWLHDETDKEFSAFYGQKTIKGQSGESGASELDELIDMIFDNQETALFVVRKLYRFFVNTDISESVESSIIQPLASLFRNNNYEVKPVLEALLSSEHFYNTAIMGIQIKSPVDFLIGFWRTCGVSMPSEASLRNDFEIRTSLLWNMTDIGQELMDPPNVAGWPAYYQIPQFDKAWITTDSVPTRALITDSFIYWGFWSENLLTNVDLLAHLSRLEDPAHLDPMLDELISLHFAVPVTASQRQHMVTILLSGQSNVTYWNVAWLLYEAEPNNEMNKNILLARIKPFFQYFFQLAEYHLH